MISPPAIASQKLSPGVFTLVITRVCKRCPSAPLLRCIWCSSHLPHQAHSIKKLIQCSSSSEVPPLQIHPCDYQGLPKVLLPFCLTYTVHASAISIIKGSACSWSGIPIIKQTLQEIRFKDRVNLNTTTPKWHFFHSEVYRQAVQYLWGNYVSVWCPCLNCTESCHNLSETDEYTMNWFHNWHVMSIL